MDLARFINGTQKGLHSSVSTTGARQHHHFDRSPTQRSTAPIISSFTVPFAQPQHSPAPLPATNACRAHQKDRTINCSDRTHRIKTIMLFYLFPSFSFCSCLFSLFYGSLPDVIMLWGVSDEKRNFNVFVQF